MRRVENAAVARAFEAYPPRMRRKLMALREVIFKTAATFRRRFPTQFTFEGNRAIVFDESDVVPVESLASCVAAALTYHRRK